MTRIKEILQGRTLPAGLDIPRITAWLNALLVLLIAYSLAMVTWQLISGAGATTLSSAAAPAAVVSGGGKGGSPSLASVAALHLFGQANVNDDAPLEGAIDAPETHLNFVLKGVFANSRNDSAMAIIASDDKNEKSYRVGDSVAGAATLHQILPDRVILKRGTQLETLFLPKEFATGAPAYSRPVPRSTPLASPILNKRGFGDLRQELLENPQAAMDMIEAQPVINGGKLVGFRVNPGKDRALFARAGLRPGDLVTEVNGTKLNDSTQMGAVFQQLKTAKQLNLTINRGGRQQNLNVSLD